ncbi:MAG: hypothetical protein M3Y82_09805 [Verrucomicrobiota bacterium]|nr:hypothetical protein [Verrucomicrobiota bacterium]
MKFLTRVILGMICGVALLILNGCATTDTDNTNVASRPWNSPKGWETGGLPSVLNEGR